MAFCEVRQLRSGWSFGQVGSVWSRLLRLCQAYLRGQNGGAITWPVVFSWISAQFPGCSHFRRRNDNHLHCQQCRLNEGQLLCTRDSPCLVCKDWLPEAWAAQAKANAQKTPRKAAAAAKAAKKASERDAMDDSVEIHAPDDTLQFSSKRSSSDGSSKAKRTKTKATSSGSSEPKSLVSTVERPSSHGSDRRRSRSADRKRRQGADNRQDSPRRRQDERSRPSYSGGSSSRKRAESGSVSKASNTRPSASSSPHHCHQSSGDRRSLSSASSRASPDRKSPSSHHERRRESADRTLHSYVVRRDVQLSSKVVKPSEKRTITVISSQARQVHVESAPEVQVPAPVTDGPADDGPATVQVPAPVADGPAGADPAAGDGSDTGDGPAISNGTAIGNGTATGNGAKTGDGPATGEGSATGDSPTIGDGPDTVDVSVIESSQSSALQFDDPAEDPARLPADGVDGSAGLGTPAATTPGDGPDVSMSTGTSSPFSLPFRDPSIRQRW